MQTTVRDLFNMFPDFELLSGSYGLNRKITTAMVVDSCECEKWLCSGELILTSGYFFRSNPSFLDILLRQLQKKGGSAIGIKLGKYVQEIPDSILRLSDSLSIPLINIPEEMRWLDIITPLLTNNINQQAMSQARIMLAADLIYKHDCSDADLSARGSMIGMSMQYGVTACVIKPEDSSLITTVCGIAAEHFCSFSNSWVYLCETSHVLFIFAPEKNENRDFINRLHLSIEQLSKRMSAHFEILCHFGIGTTKPVPTMAHDSYQEAISAIHLNIRLNRGNRIASMREMGSFRLLAQLHNNEEMKEFIQSHLGTLSKYDAEHNTNFLNILYQLMETDWNLKDTAEKMFLHYNTMKQKHQKIKDILGIQEYTKQVKFDIELALRLLLLFPDFP